MYLNKDANVDFANTANGFKPRNRDLRFCYSGNLTNAARGF